MKYSGIFSKRAAAVAFSAGLVALGAACGSSPGNGSASSGSGSGSIELDYRGGRLPGTARPRPARPVHQADRYQGELGQHRLGQPADQDHGRRSGEHLLRRRGRCRLVQGRRVPEDRLVLSPQPVLQPGRPLQSDMPQLKTFVSNGQLIGLPFDSSFLVTTVNQKDFANRRHHRHADHPGRVDGRPEEGGHGQRDDGGRATTWPMIAAPGWLAMWAGGE